MKETEKKAIEDYLERRVRECPPDKKIHFIQAGYQIDQAGRFCLFFDTRHGAGPDGSWTLEEDVLDVPTFLEFEDYERQVESKGEMIKSIVLKYRESGFFKQLNLSDDCDIGIEEFDGGWGWPSYDERKKDNLAQ